MKALILAAALAAAPVAALAQAGWEVFQYPDDGFAVQLGAKMTATKGSTYTTNAGVKVPQTVYTLTDAGVVYTMSVADFRQAPSDAGGDANITEAAAAWKKKGEVLAEETARVDRNFGRVMSLAFNDGSRSHVSVFYVNGKLYQLEGKALPPDAALKINRAMRFEQSLEFIGLGAEQFRPENQPVGRGRPFAGGPGGRDGGPPRRPPPQAFAACTGHALGDAVKLTIPVGEVEATCIQTPEGIAARPNRPPPGAPRFGPPPQG